MINPKFPAFFTVEITTRINGLKTSGKKICDCSRKLAFILLPFRFSVRQDCRLRKLNMISIGWIR
jgi:hypothetical protein